MSTVFGRFGRPGALTCSVFLAAIAALPTGTQAASSASESTDLAVGSELDTAQGQGNSANRGASLEDVVVTAQKLQERTLDVPMSLTALSGDQLSASQLYRFEDFEGRVPGLSIIGVGGFGSQLVLRGLTTGTYTINSSVATYVDETPYTANGSAGLSATIAPNLDAFDMQRVEVLRGPQGTLYGANALGGLLKYVTNSPDSSRVAAAVDAGLNSVEGGETGYNVHAMVNVPLSTDTALRVVLYDDQEPGYINDPARNLKGINASMRKGGRASLLFKPSDDLSIRFTAAYQKRSWDDYGNVDVDPMTLAPITGRRNFQTMAGNPGDVTNQLYNLTVDWKLGIGELVSATSYVDYQSHAQFDVSQSYGALFSTYVWPLFGYTGPPFGLVIEQGAGMHSIMQEVRLSSRGSGPWQWQVGGYFANQIGSVSQDTYLVDPASNSVLTASPFAPFDTGGFHNSQDYREYAAFVNLDYHFTPKFDGAVGGRYSHNRQTLHENGFGYLGGIAPTFAPSIFDTPSSQGVFTYSADARYHLTPDMMLYARVASGFVPGGGNNIPPVSAVALPRSYQSATTSNYEVGFKSSLLDGKATVEVSAFDIKWKDIQIAASFTGVLTTLNGGTAQSSGVEWNLAWMPLHGIKFTLSGDYTDAHLTEALPASVGGRDGDRLPGSPKWGTSFGVDYERSLSGSLTTFIGSNWRHTGNRPADFVAAGDRRLTVPGFDVVDLHVGVGSPHYSVTLFVKNLGDKFAINNLSSETLLGGYGPQQANIYQPRTVGLMLSGKY